MAKNIVEIPDIFTKAALYDPYAIDSDDEWGKFGQFLRFNGKFDAYCFECARERTFQYLTGIYYTVQKNNFISHHLKDYKVPFIYDFRCSWDKSHELLFFFKVKGGELIKIGQYPSLAVLASADIQRYRKVLGKEDYSELSRAVGLASHGIGIGSFVYLRRIFERLIEEAHQEAKAIVSWDESKYIQSRMDDKIGLLRGQLPEFLVEHKVLYGILSKGVHELNENECLSAFPAVRGGIELILEEKIAEQEKEKKRGEISKAIRKVHQNIKQPESRETEPGL